MTAKVMSTRSLFIACLLIWQSIECDSREVVFQALDTDDPEVIKVAEFGASRIAVNGVGHRVDEIFEAMKSESDLAVEYVVRVGLSHQRSGCDKGDCTRKMNCKLTVVKQKSSEDTLKLHSFGCTPMAVLRVRPAVNSV